MRRLNFMQKAFLAAKISYMLEQGQLEPATGSWSSGMVLVPREKDMIAFVEEFGDNLEEALLDKKNRAKVASLYRLTIDFRLLNDATITESYPLPRVDDLREVITGQLKKMYSGSDIPDAFFCVYMVEECREWTAFTTPIGRFQFIVMPQGHKNSANFFAEIVADVFKDIPQKELLVYQDDILVIEGDLEKHIEIWEKIFKRLEETNLTLKAGKTFMNYEKIKFLGFEFGQTGCKPSIEKTKAISDIAQPKSITDVRSFLGMCQYYGMFIPNLATISEPLRELTMKDADVSRDWTDERHGMAMEQLKQILTSYHKDGGIMMYPRPKQPFIVEVDASRTGRGIGAVLSQRDVDGNIRPIEYWSKLLTRAERNYTVTEIECKAVHDAIMHWNTYLQFPNEFTVYTDHHSLIYMVIAIKQTSNARVLRWMLDLQGYKFSMVYKKGKEHANADAISRLLRKHDEEIETTVDTERTDFGPLDEEEVEHAMSEIREAKQRRKQQIYSEKSIDEINTTEEQVLIVDCSNQDIMLWVTKYNLKNIPGKQVCMVISSETREEMAKINQQLSQKFGIETSNSFKVGKSKIEGAGLGLFANKPLKKGYLMDYTGKKLSKGEGETIPSDYVAGLGDIYIDAQDPFSGYGRYINDPLNDDKRNVRFKITKEGNIGIWADRNIKTGEELLVPYGSIYWEKRWNNLSDVLQEEVDDYYHIEYKIKHMVDNKQDPQSSQSTSSSHLKDKEIEQEEEENVYDGILQNEETAQNMQWLIGEKYEDNEDGRTYEIREIFYDKRFQIVVGTRRVMDGEPPSKFDADKYCVFGPDGLLELVEQHKVLYFTDYLNEMDTIKDWPTTEEQMATLQHQDDELIHTIQWVETHPGEDLNQNKYYLKQLKNHPYPLLCRKVTTVLKIQQKKRQLQSMEGNEENEHNKIKMDGGVIRQETEEEQIIIPKGLRRKALLLFHNLNGHPGVDRTKKSMRKFYYWPTCRQDITQHISECRVCKLRKIASHQGKAPIMVYDMVSRPWERTHMDLAGPFRKSGPEQYQYIMVIKDYLTKFCVMYPIRTKEAPDVMVRLTEFIVNFGPPEKLVTDRGTEFENYLIKGMSELLGIHKKRTTAYNPQADGLAENHMRTIKDMLATCVSTSQDDWAEFVSIIQLLYNTTVSSATNHTPFSLMFGRECPMHEMEEVQEMMQQPEFEEMETIIKNFAQYMVNLWEVISIKCCENQTKLNQVPIKRLEYEPYVVGEIVWYMTVPKRRYIAEDQIYLLNTKLANRFAGPYEITEVLNPVTYRIQNLAKTKNMVVHANRLKHN